MKHRLRIRDTKSGEEAFEDFDTAAQALEHLRTQIATLREEFEKKHDEPLVIEVFERRDAQLVRMIEWSRFHVERDLSFFSPCLRQHYELTPIENA